MLISLTLWQRMNLEGIIRSKRTKDGDDFLTMYETWKKIAVPDSIRKDYAKSPCDKCGQGRAIDLDALALAGETEVELEKAEARKLQTLLAEWPNFNVDDGEWLIPLKEVLNKASGESSPASTGSGSAGPTPLSRHKGARV